MQNNREIIVHYLQSNQVSYVGKIVLLEFWPICIHTNSYTYHFAELHCIHVTFPTGNSIFGQGHDWDMPKLKKINGGEVQGKVCQWSNLIIWGLWGVGCFFHLLQWYYIFTKFNWYSCCVGLSLGSPLVCSSVSPSCLQSFWQREGLQSKIYSP